MKEELKDLLDLLDIEQIEVNMFRGVSPAEGWQRVYGGQVIGQALVAASRTVEDESRVAHSLHGYFLRPGDTTIPILYSVDRIRDGRSFNTRRVVAVQKGQAIFSMSVSFQVMEEGLHHQIDYVILLSEGRLVNLGNATGHPSRIMDGSFANQVLAQMYLYERAWADHDIQQRQEVTVEVLPKALDEEVASYMVQGFGGVMTRLTKGQAEYINVPEEGPFKPEAYKY